MQSYAKSYETYLAFSLNISDLIWLGSRCIKHIVWFLQFFHCEKKAIQEHKLKLPDKCSF